MPSIFPLRLLSRLCVYNIRSDSMHVSNSVWWRSPINLKRVTICQCGVLGPQLPIPHFQLNLTSTSGEIPGIFAGAPNAFLGLWEMI